jgi:hypothetical protein
VSAIAKQTVAEVVQEASLKMQDPSYSAVMVGSFVQEQNPACHYISAHADEIGGTEQVVSTIFHAALLALCFQRAGGRSVPQMDFADLDQVAGSDVLARLERAQPALHEYICSNVEAGKVRDILCLLALAMDRVS